MIAIWNVSWYVNSPRYYRMITFGMGSRFPPPWLVWCGRIWGVLMIALGLYFFGSGFS